MIWGLLIGAVGMLAAVLFIGRNSSGISRDLHGWRGFFFWPEQPDLFSFRVTLGFITIWVCHRCIHELLHALALGKTEGR